MASSTGSVRPLVIRSRAAAAIVVALLAGRLGQSAAWTAQATATPVADLLPTPGPLPEGEPRADGPLAVVATTGILADLARQVGAPRVEVRSLLPANAGPHDFEPAPQDLVAVEDADLIIRHGLGLDSWIESLIESASPDAPVVVATDGVATLVTEPDAFAEGDPHVWFDPTRVATMVDTIATALVAVDPDGEPTYRARAEAYKGQLTELDAAIRSAIETIPPERRKLVTNHDALGYYADRYGLTVVGTVIPGSETSAEPSAKEVAALLETIKREQVPAIFAENISRPDLAAELAEQAGIEIVDDLYTDSVGEPGSGAETYLGLMRTDTILIVEALR